MVGCVPVGETVDLLNGLTLFFCYGFGVCVLQP